MVVDADRFRLSAMMFGQYLILGSWAVTLATYLMSPPTRGGLNFPPADTGLIYSTMALAGLIAPIFLGLLADRLFAAEKLMAVLHFIGAILIGLAGWWCLAQQPKIEVAYRAAAATEFVEGIPVLEMEGRLALLAASALPENRKQVRESLQRVNRAPELERLTHETFWPLFLLMLGYSFCNVTWLTLGSVIAFRNLHNPQRSFGRIRLYGTVGWIVAGVQLEFFWNTISPAALFLSAGLSIAFGLYALTLPYTPPTGRSKSLADALGLPALSIFRDGSIRVLIACSLGMAAVQQFYGVYTNRFLTELQIPYPAAVQTIAQVSEVICMMLFPFVLDRFGLKATMALGLLGWILRNGVFATESMPAVVIVGLPLHGMSYAFFFILASMYVDRKAPPHLRASAQGIFMFVSTGMGTLLGNWFSARVVQAQTVGDVVNWSNVWLVPTVLSMVFLLAYLAFFHETNEEASRVV